MENKKRNIAYTLTKDVGKLRQYIDAGQLGEVETAGQNKTGLNRVTTQEVKVTTAHQKHKLTKIKQEALTQMDMKKK